MDASILRQAVALGRQTGRAFVATSGKDGMPHLAVARRVALDGGDTVVATEWFCPGTVSNLSDSPSVSIVVWDEKSDTGFQLLGVVQAVDELAILDGFSPLETPSVPQVERALRVKVHRVLRFSQAPHTDVEESH